MTHEDTTIRQRLTGAVQRAGVGSDKERAANFYINLFLPEVKKLISEAIRDFKSKTREVM